jgi:O-antigen/teichoic acid export membrane protein
VIKVSNKNLYQDISIRAISDFLNLVLNLVVISIIARSLGSFQYGLFSQVTTTVALLIPVLLLRLNTASVRYFPKIIDSKEKIKAKFISILLIVSGFTFILCIIIFLAKDIISKLIFGSSSHSNLVIFLAIYIFVKVILVYAIDFYRAINKTRYSSIFGVIRLIFLLLFIYLVVLVNINIINVLIAYIFSEALLLLLIFIVLFRGYFRNITAGINFSGLRPYFLYSLPLVPYSILISINQLGDRFFIIHLLGIDKAGIYSFSYNLIGAAFMINTAIAYVIYPYISRMWADNDKKRVKYILEKGQNLFLYFAIPITCGLVFLYPDIVAIMAGDNFIIDRQLVLLIALGHIFLGIYSINGYIVDLSQKTMLFLIVLIISASINMILNFILIPIIGLQGAALSTFFAYFVQAIVIYFISQKLVSFKIDIDYLFILICILASTIMLIVINLIEIDSTTTRVATSVIVGVMTYVTLTYIFIWKNKQHGISSLFIRSKT